MMSRQKKSLYWAVPLRKFQSEQQMTKDQNIEIQNMNGYSLFEICVVNMTGSACTQHVGIYNVMHVPLHLLYKTL